MSTTLTPAPHPFKPRPTPGCGGPFTIPILVAYIVALTQNVAVAILGLWMTLVHTRMNQESVAWLRVELLVSTLAVVGLRVIDGRWRSVPWKPLAMTALAGLGTLVGAQMNLLP